MTAALGPLASEVERWNFACDGKDEKLNSVSKHAHHQGDSMGTTRLVAVMLTSMMSEGLGCGC